MTNAVLASRILACLFFASGMLALVAGVAGWDWFFNNYNVKFLTGRMGRRVARLLYGLLGLAIIAMGIHTWTTVPQ